MLKQLLLILLTGTIILIACSPAVATRAPDHTSVSAEPTDTPALLPTNTIVPELQTTTTLIKASAGGTVHLPDGASVRIPPNALQTDTEIVLRAVETGGPESQSPDAMANAGRVYEINLGNTELQEPVILEIPFDPTTLPSDVEPGQVFLSTFDEASGNWLYSGGTVDLDRNIITLSVTHASWWKPTTWNWSAWVNVLNSILRLNIVKTIESVNLLTSGCEQNGTHVQVETVEAQNLMQGCIDSDDPDRPVLRLVNSRLIFYEVYSIKGGGAYPPRTVLGPADSLSFEANTSDPSPLVVTALVTEETSKYLLGDLIINMLPGLNQLKIQGPLIACFTERLSDLSYFYKAVQALYGDHDGVAAAEALSKFYLDSEAMQRLIKGADDCHFGPASTLSVKGLSKIGALTSTIMGATDYIATYLSGNVYGEVAFHWQPPATPPPISTNTPDIVSSLRGTVTQRSSCRYAPSEYHLFKTGFKAQAPVKIIGRDADGDWLQIELSGGNTPCWINASLVQVEGDGMSLPDTYPTDRRLPISDAFPQVALISASPSANGVTASWVHFEIREDLKQTDAVEYVIEVWTCVDGKPAFYAVGTNDTVATFQIDDSCGVASYAHLIGQDEHGFSFPTNIPLP